jgi:hypothetical protein
MYIYIYIFKFCYFFFLCGSFNCTFFTLCFLVLFICYYYFSFSSFYFIFPTGQKKNYPFSLFVHFSRTTSACLAGAIAGVLGLTGLLNGFLFYFCCYVLLSVFQLVRIQFRSHEYFVNDYWVFINGILDGALVWSTFPFWKKRKIFDSFTLLFLLLHLQIVFHILLDFII